MTNTVGNFAKEAACTGIHSNVVKMQVTLTVMILIHLKYKCTHLLSIICSIFQ